MVLTPASQAPCKHSVEQAPVRLSGALKKVLCATPVYLITATSALPGSQAMAAPVVSGNLISWPDDGWYQVQRQDNYEAVCAGTRQCTVPAGTYIVINHDTGQRWPDTVVTGTSPVDGLVVSGNTLSWPDDGWYQVQRADTYAQVCAGTRACVVPEGTYNVINHTSGQRWENIPVEGAEGSPDGGVGADEEAPLPISELTYLLPPIVGTELPGQDVGRRTLHVDAFEAMRYYYQTPLLPDVDGDNIAELYVPVTEPGQACSSLLYLPSTQSYSPALDTTNLSPYTRIRNFSATPREDGSVHCPNDSQELHSLGDVDGDGISEIAVRYSYNGELVISGAVPWGSIVSADTPGQHAFFASDGMVISATGDVDGDHSGSGSFKLPPGRLQLLDGKSRLASRAQNQMFAVQQGAYRPLQVTNDLGRYHQRTVSVRMHQIAVVDRHTHDIHRCANFANVYEGVAGSDRGCHHREAGLHVAQIAHHAIGQCSVEPQPLVHGGMDFSPPGTDTVGIVHILYHHHSRSWPTGHVPEVLKPSFLDHCLGLGGGFLAGNFCCAGEPYHGRRLRIGGQHGAFAVVIEPSGALCDFNGIAYGRGVHFLKQLQQTGG